MEKPDRRPTALAHDPMLPRPFLIRKKRQDTHDTFTLDLEPADGSVLEAGWFLPGQFNMLYAFGVGEVPISISGDADDPTRLVHTIRSVGTVTQAIDRLKPGDLLGLRGPYGTGWPVAEHKGKDMVIMAGGIGLAPLRPAIQAILAHRGEYGRVVLLYGARTPEDLLYRPELESWRSRFDLDVQISVDAGTRDWTGRVGVVTKLIPLASFDAAHAAAFLCGPEVMMRFAVRDLRERGLDAPRIFVSMERNMKCAIGLCGHCQYGPTFVCKDGPVFRLDTVEALLARREV